MRLKRQQKKLWPQPSKRDHSSLHRIPFFLCPLPTNPTSPSLPQPLGLRARQQASLHKMRHLSLSNELQCQIPTVEKEVQRIIPRILLSRPPPPLLIQSAIRSKNSHFGPHKYQSSKPDSKSSPLSATACPSPNFSSYSSSSTPA